MDGGRPTGAAPDSHLHGQQLAQRAGGAIGVSGGVIRLQRIYNFLLLHATLSTVLDYIGLYFPLIYYFGINLLTGGPAQNCCFLPILVFRRNGISNGVQME